MKKRMTIQEAIDGFQIDNAMLSGSGYNATIERNRLAITALRRMIPTPPTHEATILRCNTCPSCRNVLDRTEEFVPGQKTFVREPACRFCGQLIDWGERQGAVE